VVDHRVVDLDQPVHFRLTDRNEARREIALADQLRAGANQLQRHEQRRHKAIADDDRDDKPKLDDEQPVLVVHQQSDCESSED
jgi:hypothetical protein